MHMQASKLKSSRESHKSILPAFKGLTWARSCVQTLRMHLGASYRGPAIMSTALGNRAKW